MLSGGCSVSGTKAVQKVTAGTAGCVYLLQYNGTFSDGEVFLIEALLAVVTPGP
jgi:branched-subunit amino acid ABC-type transport system permease component